VTARATTTSGAVFAGGRRLQLDARAVIGEGGEGRVYRAGDLAVKVFFTPDRAREKKLRDFPTHLPSRVIAPLDLVIDERHSVVGFTMRLLEGGIELHRFAQRRWREGTVSNVVVLRLFRELGDTIATLHARGIVVGDLNDGNVVVTAPSPPSATVWTPWLIDADSMQFGTYRCLVAHERFLDPRLYGIDLAQQLALDRESDWYALAVLLFGSLLYVHPFGGSHPTFGTLVRRAEARCSALRTEVKLPRVAIRPDVLPDDALAWFERVFEHDVREPLSASVLDARFIRCSCGIEHARSSCPVCTTQVQVPSVVRSAGGLRATRLFATQGRIVTAVADGGLKYAYEEDGALFREDGSVVTRSASYFSDPNRIVRIAGGSTWLGASGRFTRMARGAAVESVATGLVRGALAADAGPHGLVHVQGDALVRVETGTRIGEILEGQTHVRVGAELGFAFYRAGAITVAFVFDPRRGTLRQIESFPQIEGAMLGWSAVFDDRHVLVTLATESRGRTLHAAHLVDARGVVVATDPTGDVLGASLAGRAVANGQVLVTGPDGLVLVRAERHHARFSPTRVFADAKDLVPPDADLLVGPGGSLFVVTHDEITHLCFTH
jgi:hypothetical protein